MNVDDALKIILDLHDSKCEAELKLKAWEELWKAIKEMEPEIGDANKPLAIASSYALLLQERNAARSIVADVNNSVFGSQSYFTSPSCIDAIEDLKMRANQRPFT